jgi:hypothetical protein
MNRLLLVVGFAVTLIPWALAQDLTAEELARATAHLKATSARFLGSTKGLSEAQLNFKPGPTRWSVAEVAEHIASTEDFLMEMILNKVMKGPARPEPVNVREIDDFITTSISDRTKKAQAPEPLAPTNRFGSAAESVKHFQESRAKTLAFLKDTKGLRDHAIDSPVGRKLDAYQWVLFISAHCERHTKQIDEVRADPGFPKQ